MLPEGVIPDWMKVEFVPSSRMFQRVPWGFFCNKRLCQKRAGHCSVWEMEVFCRQLCPFASGRASGQEGFSGFSFLLLHYCHRDRDGLAARRMITSFKYYSFLAYEWFSGGEWLIWMVDGYFSIAYGRRLGDCEVGGGSQGMEVVASGCTYHQLRQDELFPSSRTMHLLILNTNTVSTIHCYQLCSQMSTFVY